MLSQKSNLQQRRIPKSGFTLIELLVVFTVIAILAGVSLVSLVSYSRSQQVQQVASNLKLLVNQARHSALSAVKTNQDEDGDTVSCGNNQLVGYSVQVIGTTELVLFKLCNGSGPFRLKTVAMPENLSFTTGTTCTQIQFSSLNSNVSGVPCNLVVRGYGQNKTITVDSLGNTAVQ